MAGDERGQSKKTVTQKTYIIITTAELQARVEELETEIRTLKDVSGPLVSAFLKNKQLAKDVGNAATFDPQATDSICEILHLVTKHVQDFEKTVSGLEQKLLKTNNLLTDQIKSKDDLTNLLREVGESPGLEDILGKLRIIFKLSGVIAGPLFKTTKSEVDELEVEDYTPEFENIADAVYNATDLDNDGNLVYKNELYGETDVMDIIMLPAAVTNACEDELVDDASGGDTDYSDMDDGHDISDSGEPKSAKMNVRSSKTNNKSAFNDPLKEHSCRVCHKVFLGSAALVYHMRSKHSEYRPYACDLCDDTFSTAGKLREHKSKFHGGKPYTCKICGASWETPSRLERHMNIHTKPYKCSQCDKCFGERKSLVQHLHNHENNKPFRRKRKSPS